jgi:hypothetical protein
MPANILNLPCYKVLGIQENEHDYHIDVETLEAPTSCPPSSPNATACGRSAMRCGRMHGGIGGCERCAIRSC